MKITEAIVWIITLLLLGAIGVLIIKNPQGASQAFGTIFQGFNLWARTLSGTGYVGTSTPRKR